MTLAPLLDAGPFTRGRVRALRQAPAALSRGDVALP